MLLINCFSEDMIPVDTILGNIFFGKNSTNQLFGHKEDLLYHLNLNKIRRVNYFNKNNVTINKKVKDYKSLWSSKKKRNKIYNESNYDKASQYGAASKYGAASPYSAASKSRAASEYSMGESITNIVKEELLNEVTYHKFKNEVKFRTKNEQLHKAIREVKRKLQEIDRIVEYTSRMKQELSEGEEGLKYWKKTESNIVTISEMVNHLNNKIKNLNQ
jgi:hypothetical protein